MGFVSPPGVVEGPAGDEVCAVPQEWSRGQPEMSSVRPPGVVEVRRQPEMGSVSPSGAVEVVDRTGLSGIPDKLMSREETAPRPF